jgi:hypothetical protein
MDYPSVIVVGLEDLIGPIVASLAVHGLRSIVLALAPGVASHPMQQSAAAWVLVGLPGDMPARMIRQLKQGAGTRLSPIVVVQAQPDLAARDAVLITGASDVSVAGTPASVGTLVDALVRGWFRSAPLRPWEGTLKVNRRGDWTAVRVRDVDPSGVGLADGAGLSPDDLLRLTLPLPRGEEVSFWGRLCQSGGSPAIRFVGAPPEERQRLSVALSEGSLPTPQLPDAETTHTQPVAWPAEHADLLATEKALMALSRGELVSAAEGVPPVPLLREMFQRVRPTDFDAFLLPPPDGVADPALFRQVMAVRAHLFVARRTGDEHWRDGTQLQISAAGVERLAVAAGIVLAAIQRVVAETVALGRADRLRTLGQLQQDLVQDIETLRPVLARFGLSFPVMMPHSTLPLFPVLPPAMAGQSEDLELDLDRMRPPAEAPAATPPKRRLAYSLGWSAALALAVAVLVLAWHRSTAPAVVLSPSAAALPSSEDESHASDAAPGVPGVTGVIVGDGEVQVLVVDNWRPSGHEFERLRQYLMTWHRPRARVLDPQHRTLTAGPIAELRRP